MSEGSTVADIHLLLGRVEGKLDLVLLAQADDRREVAELRVRVDKLSTGVLVTRLVLMFAFLVSVGKDHIEPLIALLAH